MKQLFVIFSFLMILLNGSLEARNCHELTIDGSNITISVLNPEDCEEETLGDLDLVFKDSKDKGRKLCFHYFLDPNFDLKSFSEVLDYTDWLIKPLFPNSNKSQTSFFSNKDYAVRTFKTSDFDGTSIYCYIYVGKIENELVFASISTSYISFENAIKDMELFTNNISWRK